MRTIINYIRSLFCNHEFKYEEQWAKMFGFNDDVVKEGEKVSRTCKKCGWHKKYWKF